jgi:hypothetical protein
MGASDFWIIGVDGESTGVLGGVSEETDGLHSAPESDELLLSWIVVRFNAEGY